MHNRWYKCLRSGTVVVQFLPNHEQAMEHIAELLARRPCLE